MARLHASGFSPPALVTTVMFRERHSFIKGFHTRYTKSGTNPPAHVNVGFPVRRILHHVVPQNLHQSFARWILLLFCLLAPAQRQSLIKKRVTGNNNLPSPVLSFCFARARIPIVTTHDPDRYSEWLASIISRLCFTLNRVKGYSGELMNADKVLESTCSMM